MAFPQDPLTVTIEIYYDAAWQDITAYVYHRDAAPITITRGYTANSKNCDPGKLTCQLNNRDARFSPRNPTSPLYGKIGRNTPLRVSVTYSAVTYTRFVGEVVSWPPRWDVSGKDIWVPLEVAGILRRLNRGEKPIRASINLTILADNPLHYWRLDDAEGSTYGATSLPNGTVNLTVFDGTIGWAALSGPPGGEVDAPRMNDGILSAEPRDAPPPWTFEYSVLRPSDGSLDADLVATVAYDVDGLTTSVSTTVLEDADVSARDWYHYQILGVQNGANYEIQYWRNGLYKGIAQTGAGILGNLNFISLGSEAAADDWAIGYAAIHLSDSVDAEEHSNALQAYAGEQAHERFARINTQTGTPYTVVGSASMTMSVQRSVTHIQSLNDAVNADQALMYERRDALGLVFRTNASRYNQIPVELDYSAGHISPPFDPEPDDQQVANDREVKGRAGGYHRAELAAGSLSVQDPPDGVGRYDDTITVDIFDPAQAVFIAGHRLWTGTWDAERYPSVRVDLSAPGNNALIPDITSLDTGDLLTISDLPTWLAPGAAELAVAGYKEVIAFYAWDFTFACWPGGPWQVGTSGDGATTGRWSQTAGTELMTARNTTDTSLTVHTQSGPKWPASFTHQPVLELGGETVTLTAVSNVATSFVAAGTAAHANNASVTPGLPAGLAAGDVLLVFAAIRNSGTGVPDTPSGYEILADMGNAKLFGKYAATGEAAPTITFTGGAANADTSAQCAAFRGVGLTVHDVETQLNSSAADIAYPALPVTRDNCAVLYLGWKQDDWTSVATAGTAEIGEPDTTIGDDQGLCWGYTLQTTATSITAGSFVVTGGSSAISCGAVIALGSDVQTMTVTRSVNAVVKSHAARSAIRVDRPAIAVL